MLKRYLNVRGAGGNGGIDKACKGEVTLELLAHFEGTAVERLSNHKNSISAKYAVNRYEYWVTFPEESERKAHGKTRGTKREIREPMRSSRE